ncbi:MAG: hypothetical protein ACP6IQ_01825 [Candidatus Njordarchaeia archaeon]
MQENIADLIPSPEGLTNTALIYESGYVFFACEKEIEGDDFESRLHLLGRLDIEVTQSAVGAKIVPVDELPEDKVDSLLEKGPMRKVLNRLKEEGYYAGSGPIIPVLWGHTY